MRRRILKRTREERTELLSLYDGSGMSQAAFAREFDINYTTFCGWLKGRSDSAGDSESMFQEVHLEPASGAEAWELDCGKNLCLRLGSNPDVKSVADLLKRLRS